MWAPKSSALEHLQRSLSRLSMPDSFFAASKNRKRKRSTTRDAGPSSSKKVPKGVGGKGRKPDAKTSTASKKRRAADEELSDETRDDDDQEGIDDMDLRAPDVDPDAYESGEEDEDETPAQKRLRLAKLYLDGVKQGLSLGASIPELLRRIPANVATKLRASSTRRRSTASSSRRD